MKIVEEELKAHANISLHLGKTQVWNQSGVVPAGIEEISRAARLVKPDAIVWRGDEEFPLAQQGIRVLGASIGRTEFVVAHLEGKTREHEVLFQRILAVKDTQACWLLLLMCASSRANFWLRMIRPEETRYVAERHDGLVWECLKGVLGTSSAPLSAKATANLPLSMGGLGLTSALEVRTAAFWASWADSMKMVKERHPTIANELMVGIDREEGPCFQSVRTCQQLLVDAGFLVPPWPELVHTTSSRVGPGAKPTQVWVATESRQTTPRAQAGGGAENFD